VDLWRALTLHRRELVGVAVAVTVQLVPALPELAGMGATPHRWAKAASPRSRSGCWPAVTSGWPAGRNLAQVVDQRRHREIVERLADRGRGGDQQGLELVDGRGASVAGASAVGAQDADRLDDPVAPLGRRGRRARQHGPGGGLGVDRVRPARWRRVRRSGRSTSTTRTCWSSR
jgi:hypothetical protein